MAETRETVDIKHSLMRSLRKQGTFVCPEVTIGIGGIERVDVLSWDTDGTWRAYEIKVTVSDFHSSAAKSFVGHLNYFAMPKALYERVKYEIPDGVGVWCDGCIVRRPTRKEPTVDNEILMASLMRSCYRDAERYQKCESDGVDQWDEKIRKIREQARKTIRTQRQNLESYRRLYGADQHHRDGMLDYWRHRAQKLEIELRELRKTGGQP